MKTEPGADDDVFKSIRLKLMKPAYITKIAEFDICD